MVKDEKRPAVRFAGFTDPWEQRKLGDLMDVGSVKRIHQSDWTSTGIRFLRARDIVSAAKNEEPSDYLYISEERYREYSILSGKVQEGDLLVTGVGTIGVPFLIVDDTEIYFKDGNIIWFKNAGVLDGQFFYYSFIGERIQSFIKESAGIGTVGTYTIDSGKKTPIMLPDVREQRQLGSFFTQLDNLITLHQRKCDKLISVKKSMLEKMFPQNGSNVPEIRFAGFTDPWEQRKLYEIADVLDGDRGNNYPNGNDFQESGHTLFLSAANVTSNGFLFDNNQYITEEKSNSMGNGKLIVDDIVLTSRGSIGHIAWYNEAIQQIVPFARINSGMLVLRSKDLVISNLVAHFLKSPLGKKQIDFISFGSAQPQLTKKDVSNYIVSFPSDCNEQRKIADFFDYMENLITLHQRKLEKLKNIKKSLLGKMFV